MLHRVFSICLLLLPPAQTVIQLSMLDCASGRRSECVFFPHVARFVPGSGGEKGKGGGSEWSKHRSCTQYCDSAGRIVI